MKEIYTSAVEGMMSRFKFRAWDEYSKRMMYRDFSIWCNGEVSDTEGNYLDNLMQYTGLKDKHGKDIYEGDILRFKDCVGTGEYNSWDEEVMEPFLNSKVVSFGNIGWENVGHWNCKGNYTAEIIGNIYENSNLIES